MKARLEFEDVNLGYRKKCVLRGISFSVYPGQWVSLVGANGAGKTTLLMAAAGLLEPQSGRIRLKETDIKNYSPRQRARHLALVRQAPEALYPFSCQEIVLFGRYPHGRSERDEDIVRRAMATTDVLHLASQPITAVSGGERQRVFLARALAQEAEIILLDEPAAHLDPAQAQGLFRHLKRLTEEGRSVLCALHDLNAVATFSSRVILLGEGRIIAQGPPLKTLTPENLRRVFGAEFSLYPLPEEGRALIVPR